MIPVIKIGGSIIEDENLLAQFLGKVAALESPFVLIHGGGKNATQLAKQLGIETKMIDGRRITDEKMLKIIVMTYAGWLNKMIVAKLQSMNCNAVGLSGADGSLIRSSKRNPIPVDYGFAGDPDIVNVEFLKTLLQSNFVPVIAPVTHDGAGNLLNTNADTIAAVVASALAKTQEVRLIFCFEKDGVLQDFSNENSIIERLSANQKDELEEAGKIHSGMLPKLNAGFQAKKNGVHQVIIGNAMKISELVELLSPCTLLEN